MRRCAAVVVAIALAAAPALAVAGSRSKLFAAIEAEMESLDRALAIDKGIEAAERERESLEWAREVLEHRSRESVRRLDAYRGKRVRREEMTRTRARAMYKLARGGMLRIAFEEARPGVDAQARRDAAAARIVRGRTIRWLVKHDLRELSAHFRAERRAGSELLAASREMAALGTLYMVEAVEVMGLDATREAMADETRSAARRRRRLETSTEVGAHGQRLLRRLARKRYQYNYGKGLDLMEARSLVRPVPGRIVGRFGDYKDALLKIPMHRNGVEIRAQRRDKVRAIAPGRVAMVGSLPGYDDVVVMDHGDGYLSLTGRLLAVEVVEGQTLEANAVLGRPAPKSIDDGLGRTVYLEVRHGERPVDASHALDFADRPPLE